MLTGIHFLLTYSCTSECDHCFLYCSPNAKGTFTGTMQTPQGMVPGNGKKLDIVYSFEIETNAAGKITRFAVAFDMQDFARQLGMG